MKLGALCIAGSGGQRGGTPLPLNRTDITATDRSIAADVVYCVILFILLTSEPWMKVEMSTT